MTSRVLSMRDKGFWRRLTKAERRELMALQTSRSSTGYGGGGGYLPDDCSECGACGEAILGTGWCSRCYRRYEELTAKGSGKALSISAPASAERRAEPPPK